MTKYNRQKLIKPESKPSKTPNTINRGVIFWTLIAGCVLLLSGCETLKVCQGTQVCAWQEVAPVVCPEKQKIPAELLTPLRLKPELDKLLSTQTR